MMTKKPNTKEQLVDYLSKYISLGTYDKRFVNNILQLNISSGKSVTTNQSMLLDKIVLRYHRQLAKEELNSKDLINLPWTLPPITSSPIYTEAHIAIMDDTTITIHSPYKKDFVKELRQVDFMNWDRENKMWSAIASEYTLKKILEIVNSYYDKVNYCPIVQQVIDTAKEYETIKYWNPTLVRLNGNLYVMAANAPLMEAIKHLPLDTGYDSLARLSRMGIRIEPSLISDIHDELGGTEEAMNKLIFSLDPQPKIEISATARLIEYLQLIKADMVLLAEWFGTNKDIVMELANLLKANNIPHKVLKSKSGNLSKEKSKIDLRKCEMPVKINMSTFTSHGSTKHVAKTIQIVNSSGIYIEYK
jgi:hypothetical protein